MEKQIQILFISDKKGCEMIQEIKKQIIQECDCCKQGVCNYLIEVKDVKTKINLNNKIGEKHIKKDITFTYNTHLVENQKQGLYLSQYVYKDSELSKEAHNIWQYGYYIDDIKNGFWITYFDTGVKKSQGNFNMGKRSGLWSWYHENGNIYSQGSYECGQLHNMWMFYKENGDILKYGSYNMGDKINTWTYQNDQNQQYQKTYYQPKQKFQTNKRKQNIKKQKQYDDEGFMVVTE